MSEWKLLSPRVDEDLGQLMLGRRHGTCEGLLYNLGRWRSHSLRHWERPEDKEENSANSDTQGTSPKGREHSQRSAGQFAANKCWCFLRGLLLIFCSGPVWLCCVDSVAMVGGPQCPRSSSPAPVLSVKAQLTSKLSSVFPASCCPAFQFFEA